MNKKNLYNIFESMTDSSQSEFLKENMNINAIKKIAFDHYDPISESDAAIILAYLYLYVESDSWHFSTDRRYRFFEEPLTRLSDT